MCVRVLSDPSGSICGPVVEIRSLMPLSTVCLVQEGLFAASHTERQICQTTACLSPQAQDHSPFPNSSRSTKAYLKLYMPQGSFFELQNSLKLGKF